AETTLTPFEKRLKDSLDWLESTSTERGTIQIMSMGFDSFDVSAFFDYLRRLESEQIDTNSIQVFETVLGGKKVYSVMYGNYPTRRQAADNIEKLPDILTRASPISRSVGGIQKEIRRLSVEN
ncbi:MAG: SPOR domain-containing protein, partial [Pseudomonadota bacterium]